MDAEDVTNILPTLSVKEKVEADNLLSEFAGDSMSGHYAVVYQVFRNKLDAEIRNSLEAEGLSIDGLIVFCEDGETGDTALGIGPVYPWEGYSISQEQVIEALQETFREFGVELEEKDIDFQCITMC